MDMEGPLNFEAEDLILNPPIAVKRRKVIGLDDLVKDHYNEKNKVEREFKQGTKKCCNSDDDDDRVGIKQEALVSKFVKDCEKQVDDIIGEDESSVWGCQVFGRQKNPPSLSFPDLAKCKMLRTFTENEHNSLLDFSISQGEAFLEKLLINGWLLNLANTCGYVEDLVASWTFNLMLYSSDLKLQSSSCDFWCAIIQSKSEDRAPYVHLTWFPTYEKLMDALDTYGCLLDSSFNKSSLTVSPNESGPKGPPQNIISWFRFLSACCQLRSKYSIFKPSQMEELASVIICLFVDCRLQGLSLLLNDCLASAINYFSDEEWKISHKKIADSLAYRIPQDLNCLRSIECISCLNNRCKQLRSEAALRSLQKLSDTEEIDAELLRTVMSINMKSKDCNFFKVYISLVLAENWLFFSPISLGERPDVLHLWSTFLRNCSCQITSTDWRSYASKVRNKASYLLQSTIHRNQD